MAAQVRDFAVDVLLLGLSRGSVPPARRDGWFHKETFRFRLHGRILQKGQGAFVEHFFQPESKEQKTNIRLPHNWWENDCPKINI